MIGSSEPVVPGSTVQWFARAGGAGQHEIQGELYSKGSAAHGWQWLQTIQETRNAHRRA